MTSILREIVVSDEPRRIYLLDKFTVTTGAMVFTPGLSELKIWSGCALLFLSVAQAI